jgi:hypothetical protein
VIWSLILQSFTTQVTKQVSGKLASLLFPTTLLGYYLPYPSRVVGKSRLANFPETCLVTWVVNDWRMSDMD